MIDRYPDRRYNPAAEAAKLDKPQVADTFLLNYGGSYHGITVVAVEPSGNGFVTLEAHASKLRKKPDFHQYTGMIDFIAKTSPSTNGPPGGSSWCPVPPGRASSRPRGWPSRR